MKQGLSASPPETLKRFVAEKHVLAIDLVSVDKLKMNLLDVQNLLSKDVISDNGSSSAHISE